jgi:hypothetical protein
MRGEISASDMTAGSEMLNCNPAVTPIPATC